jgi:hypothetical protein
MLNSKFMSEQAEVLALRLEEERPEGLKAQIAHAIRLTTGRVPEAKEIGADLKFIESQAAEEKMSPQAALRHYCLLILNTNEFVYLD